MSHFSENRHPEWQDKAEKWEFAWDHYTGEYVDTGKIGDYLFQKHQREGTKAFESRRKDPDPILHFPTAVDGINGIIASKAKEIQREWGELGDPEQEGTIAYALLRNADGQGMNWSPLMKRVGIKQTVMHTVWGLVEGINKDRDGNVVAGASVKVLNPQSVVDWYPRIGNPTQVLVKERRETRKSIMEEAELQDVYTLFELDGWRRFVISDESETTLDEGEYEYWGSSKKEIRVLPIFRVELPLPRMIGYLLAKKQNHIFNFKSIRDHGASNLSLAILKIKASDTQYNSITNSLTKGHNTIREDPDVQGAGHQFMTPDGSYLSEAGEILKKDIEDFYHNAFKEYGDTARQSTATEIIQKSSTGIEAFLALLVSSIDEFENQCFLRLLQVYFPNRPVVWGSAYVRRPTDYQPEDIRAALEEMKKRFFGDAPVPVPNKYKVELVAKLLADEGINIEDDQELSEFLSRTIDTRLAEAVARLADRGLSTEELVRVLRPEWDDAQVKAEAERINRERGGSLPDPFIGG